MTAAIALPMIVAVDIPKRILLPDPWQVAARSNFLATLNRPFVAVKYSKPSKVRSLNQNSYYWGVVLTAIAEHTGHSTEELHELFKKKFLSRKFREICGEVVEVYKSTTKLTTEEFAVFLTQVIAFAGTLGIVIPDVSQL